MGHRGHSAFTLSHEVTRRPGQEPSRQEKGVEGGVAAVRTDRGVCHQGLSWPLAGEEQGRAGLPWSTLGMGSTHRARFIRGSRIL